MNLKHLAPALCALLPLTAGAAGALDPSFGIAGRATFDFTPEPQRGERGSAVAVRSDGKLLVVSETDADPTRIVVSRHDSDGTLDASFGSSGRVVLAFDACATCAVTSPSFAVLDNGSIVVAATETVATVSSNIAVTRITASGALDSTFGTGGVARVNPTGRLTVVNDIAVQADGRILLAGSAGSATSMRWLVARLNVSGSADNDFVDWSNGGGAPGVAQRIAVQSSGHIVVVGKDATGSLRGYRYGAQSTDVRAFSWTFPGDFTDLAIDFADRAWALASGYAGSSLIRLSSQFDIDATFLPPALPADSFFASVLPLPTGEAFVAGSRGFVAPQGAGVFAGGTLVKLATSGRVDTSFGDAGRMGLDHALVNRLALQSNGRVVLAGAQDTASTESGVQLALMRIDPSAGPFVSTQWLGFPVQSLGTRSATQTVTVTNSSTSARTVSLQKPANFEVAGCADSLAAGASCQLSITHVPSSTPAPLGFLDYASAPLVIADSAGRQATLNLYAAVERSLVQHFYRSILRRDADWGGWGYWNGEARRLRTEIDAVSGATGTTTSEAWFAMAMTFLGSPEYATRTRDDDAYVTDLYRTFFDRPADDGGLAYWRGQLGLGLPREMILNAFLFSQEFTAFNATHFGGAPTRPEVDLVMDMYRGLLGRLPDSAGLAYWVPRMQGAQCQGPAAVQAQADTLSGAFAGSDEYKGRGRDNTRYVSDLYNAFLRRAGDAEGFGYWRSGLDNGTITREAARRAFLGSPEFGARVQRVIAAGCRG